MKEKQTVNVCVLLMCSLYIVRISNTGCLLPYCPETLNNYLKLLKKWELLEIKK